MQITLRNADGERLETISAARLKRLVGLGFIRRVINRKDGKPIAAIMWPRDKETVLSRLPVRAYSWQERWDIYRVWRLLRIPDAERPVFLTSITDNLVFVDPVTGKKTKAAQCPPPRSDIAPSLDAASAQLADAVRRTRSNKTRIRTAAGNVLNIDGCITQSHGYASNK